MYRAMDYTDAINKAKQLINDGGLGHTSSLYVNTITEENKIEEFYNSMKTGRVLINTPSSHGGIGDLYNFKLSRIKKIKSIFFDKYVFIFVKLSFS